MDETVKLIAQTGTLGGMVVVSLYFLGRVVLKVADRLIAAIDRVSTKMDEHTANETAHVGELRADIAVIRDRLGLGSDDETPIPGRRRTPALGIIKRPPTEPR